ncbi:hypothetical protein KPH14_009889 [Odynerus spinipes]|uniref:Uncharacterized protein n=1 Tax=Odynerus spinipes TaxID=1348599 RepID=A0AAD9RE98_9HYME|nr:hypothetical protein KPH14_009889 [Odynerus spinipes]
MDTWARKQLHGKHYYITRNENIGKTDTYRWLQKGSIFPETEGFLMAIQDQDDRCRKCKQTPETIDHITGGCKLLASTEYMERHNMTATIIRKEIANRYNLEQSKTPYYKYTPTTIIENETHKLYWDVTIHTDKTMKYNRPGITLIDKKEKITYLIEISIPNDANLASKYNNKIEKYHPLAQEIQRIWNQKKVFIIPHIVSATEITPHSFKKHLQQLKLEPHIYEQIQKAVILKTCKITWKFLNLT